MGLSANEEQLTNYEARIDYYTKYINSRDDWEFIGVYPDDGISATTTKKREGDRVGGGFRRRPLTPPDMRFRIRRFS